MKSALKISAQTKTVPNKEKKTKQPSELVNLQEHFIATDIKELC